MVEWFSTLANFSPYRPTSRWNTRQGRGGCGLYFFARPVDHFSHEPPVAAGQAWLAGQSRRRCAVLVGRLSARLDTPDRLLISPDTLIGLTTTPICSRRCEDISGVRVTFLSSTLSDWRQRLCPGRHGTGFKSLLLSARAVLLEMLRPAVGIKRLINAAIPYPHPIRLSPFPHPKPPLICPMWNDVVSSHVPRAANMCVLFFVDRCVKFTTSDNCQHTLPSHWRGWSH